LPAGYPFPGSSDRTQASPRLGLQRAPLPGPAAADPAEVIEEFVRSHFSISEQDVRFSRTTPLFESGYVDSIGVIELIAFIEDTFPVEIPDDLLLSDGFTTIDGIAAAVTERLRRPARRRATHATE
jgi:acyl carrier protein